MKSQPVMQKINLSQAEPGMVLAKAVTLGGTVLCGEGTELTPAIISRMKAREIDLIVVQGEAVADEAEISASCAQRKQELSHRFRRLRGDEFMMEIKSAFERQFDREARPAEPAEGEAADEGDEEQAPD